MIDTLTKRVITALIVWPLFIFVIWFLPGKGFALLTAAMVVIAAWEWSALAGIRRLPMRGIYSALLVLSIALAFFMPFTVLVIDFLVWVWGSIAILAFSKNGRTLGFGHRVVKAAVGLLVLTGFWLAVNVLRNTLMGTGLLLLAFTLVWAVDIAAYFVGRRWGKHRLAPDISPNKTLEGAVAGMVAAVIVALSYGAMVSMSWHRILLFAVFALLVAVFVIIGDLFESLLKRQAGVKDSGHIFPGHGGMLDRFDGALAALPFFVLGLLIF